MEKILVAIDSRRGAWEALSHACSLAGRIDAVVNVLLVSPPHSTRPSAESREVEEAIKKRLLLLIEAAQARGVKIHYFITEGGYEQEVITFINKYKISLFIYEADAGKIRPGGKDQAYSSSLPHRISCTVERVFTKKKTA